jgi:hypothetical protein
MMLLVYLCLFCDVVCLDGLSKMDIMVIHLYKA